MKSGGAIGKRGAVAVGLVWGLAVAPLSFPQVLLAQQPPFFEYAQIDPHKVVTAEKCGECHIQEAEVWKRTPHAVGFKTLHKKEQAEAIAKKMGFRLIKRDSLCFSCHYTPLVQADKIRVVSGVSCESCHGAGADYLDVHNEYGDGFDHNSEPADHRRARIANSRRAGMRRPSDLYPVAANCFSCHTVPLERLVNEGGHTTGSAAFELVEWTQGEIRHNFLKSTLDGTNAVNVERPMSRKRVMYVVGRALDLEYSVRGLAKAKTDGVYSKAMSRRVRSAVSEVRAISRAADIAEVAEILSAVKSVRMVPRNEAQLLAAAERVRKATQSFLRQSAPPGLASLDDLVRGIDPEPEEDEVQIAGGAETSETGAPGDFGTPEDPGRPRTGDTRASGASGSSAGPASRTTATGSGVTGAIRTRIRPSSSHKTIGPANCSGCHTEQNERWFAHAHFKSVDPFFDGEAKNLQIAQLYGVKPSQLTTGRAVCMDCHGTIISGKESREVLDGVGCESCHGAAGDWLEPHKNEANKELGRQRPGHQAALKVGKLDLRQPRRRAEVCTGCHYITEPRLLSAGHPSGAQFDYVKGMNEVRHWQQRLEDSRMASAIQAAVASRGAVPKVRVASLPSGSSLVAAARTATGRSRAGRSGQPKAETYVLRPPAPRPIDFSKSAAASGDSSAAANGASGENAGAIDLSPLPDLAGTDGADGATIEEALLAVQQRLKLLYQMVDPINQGQGSRATRSSGGSQ